MLKKLGYILGTIFLFLTVLITSFWMNLSSKKLTPWIQSQINSQLPSEYQVRIDRSSTLPMKLEVEHIEIFKKDEIKPIFQIHNLQADFNLLKVLFNMGIPYHVDLYEGYIDGVFKLLPEFSVTLKGESLQPNRNRMLRKTKLVLSNPIATLDGNINMSEPLEGNLALVLKSVKISGKPENTNLPLELPQAEFSSLSSKIEIKAQRITLNMTSKGDFEGKLSGTLLMSQKQFRSSNINFSIVGDFSDTYNGKLESLGFINSILSSYRKPSGTISINITGTPGTPNVKKI